MIQTSPAVESHIENDFCGLTQGNRYQLANGQVWEQVEPVLWAWVWVRPRVQIFETDGIYKMKVERIDHPVTVRRVA